MKLLQVIFGIISVLGTIGNGILFLYIEWMFLRQSFIQILNPLLHFQVLGVVLINPFFWLFLTMSIVGSYAVSRIEKSVKQSRRQVKISREEVKSQYPQLFPTTHSHPEQIKSSQPEIDPKVATSVQTQQRPYIEYRTDKLEMLAVSDWEDLRILEIIHYELEFRSRKKAVELRQKITTRLTELQRSQVEWPSTTVKVGLSNLPGGTIEVDISYGEGILSHYGYKVGINGLSRKERWEILDRVFLNPLLKMDNTAYLHEWGEPNSEKRLKKLANSIAAFTRNAKRRRRGNFGQAIEDWEADLAYLKRTYYNNIFSFKYPRPNS